MSDRDARFVIPTTARLRVMRDGHNIIRSVRIPKPVVLVDTREKEPQYHPTYQEKAKSVLWKDADFRKELNG